jgi:uncharacterized protein
VPDTSKLKIIFIPGNGGGDIKRPGKWYASVSKELEGLGFKVICQNFPDPIKARKEYWIPFLEKLGADENTALIGASSGAVAAMRYAENHKILGSLLVAAAHTDQGLESEKISGFFDQPWDWDAIKSNQNWIIQFHSADDPVVPVEEGHFIKDKLNTEYHEFTDQQHFGHPNPKTEFPEIVEFIKNRLQIQV